MFWLVIPNKQGTRFMLAVQTRVKDHEIGVIDHQTVTSGAWLPSSLSTSFWSLLTTRSASAARFSAYKYVRAKLTILQIIFIFLLLNFCMSVLESSSGTFFHYFLIKYLLKVGTCISGIATLSFRWISFVQFPKN